MVPKADDRSAYAQAIAFACHMHPNTKGNGIYLRQGPPADRSDPASKLLPVYLQKRALHADTFGPEHLRRVNEILGGIGSPDGSCSSPNRVSAYFYVRLQLTTPLSVGVVPSTRSRG